MPDELAAASVDRSRQLAAPDIAIGTFLLSFVPPRYAGGEVGPFPFQATLVAMGVATAGGR